MSPRPTFAAELALLSAALDDPDIDLATELAAFADIARAAVASYLGLTITARIEAVATALSIPPAPWASPPQASIRILPPTSAPGVAPVVAITLFAATPGAFVDLAADLAYLGADALSDIAVDDDLPGSSHRATAVTADLVAIHPAGRPPAIHSVTTPIPVGSTTGSHAAYRGVVIHTWTEGRHLDGAERALARLMVERAVGVIAQQRRADVERAASTRPAESFANRQLDAATRILMTTAHFTVEDAFELLADRSERTHRPLAHIAAQVIRTGIVPPAASSAPCRPISPRGSPARTTPAIGPS